MKSYFAIVEKDADSAFGVWFPDVPGCFSAADLENEVMANAVEALQLWAEDTSAPPPSTHEQILGKTDVRGALEAGAYLISVPFIENDAAVVRANVTFERGVLKAIDQAAASRGLTRSAFLSQAARNEIEARH